jgi:DNA (cytosine-5)-methyltransferase 1
MRFADLFAGLGGFNLALRKIGHECVFASEIDPTLRELYASNFGIEPQGDIQKVDVTKIPAHEILCAGFPCQPFSKAGRQDGLGNPELGGLYKDILKVIRYHHPRFLILENVPNFEMHDYGQTWKLIKHLLEKEGYEVSIRKLSPHRFGIPQIRERVYIVGSNTGLDEFEWPSPTPNQSISIEDYLDRNPKEAHKLPNYVNRCLDVWQDFLDKVPVEEKIPHPLWSMEFGATYPYEKITPARMAFHDLKAYRGSFGQRLSDAADIKDLFSFLPSHARRDQQVFPDWKIRFIRKSREFYQQHQNWLDDWIPNIRTFSSSLQKLEWNCQSEKVRNIRRYILQIRPSGVRVKRRTTAPSLVAMTTTQVPIIAWEDRYVTVRECIRLQSMDGPEGLRILPTSEAKTYEALGNAINVKVAILVAEALVGEEKEIEVSLAS